MFGLVNSVGCFNSLRCIRFGVVCLFVGFGCFVGRAFAVCEHVVLFAFVLVFMLIGLIVLFFFLCFFVCCFTLFALGFVISIRPLWFGSCVLCTFCVAAFGCV